MLRPLCSAARRERPSPAWGATRSGGVELCATAGRKRAGDEVAEGDESLILGCYRAVRTPGRIRRRRVRLRAYANQARRACSEYDGKRISTRACVGGSSCRECDNSLKSAPGSVIAGTFACQPAFGSSARHQESRTDHVHAYKARRQPNAKLSNSRPRICGG